MNPAVCCGGVVIGIVRGGKFLGTLLNVRDDLRGCTWGQRIHEWVIGTHQPVKVALGDLVHWQGAAVYWTPAALLDTRVDLLAQYLDWDIPLPRLGEAH